MLTIRAKWPCVIPGGNCGTALEDVDGTGLTEFARKTRAQPSAGQARAAIMRGGVSVARGTERGASPHGYLPADETTARLPVGQYKTIGAAT